jgi:hypothetical protein
LCSLTLFVELGKADLRYWRHVQDAVTKGAEGDAGVADVGVVGQDDLEHGEVANDGRADGGYEEEDSANEEEESAKKMDGANFCHPELRYLVVSGKDSKELI